MPYYRYNKTSKTSKKALGPVLRDREEVENEKRLTPIVHWANPDAILAFVKEREERANAPGPAPAPVQPPAQQSRENLLRAPRGVGEGTWASTDALGAWEQQLWRREIDEWEEEAFLVWADAVVFPLPGRTTEEEMERHEQACADALEEIEHDNKVAARARKNSARRERRRMRAQALANETPFSGSVDSATGSYW